MPLSWGSQAPRLTVHESFLDGSSVSQLLGAGFDAGQKMHKKMIVMIGRVRKRSNHTLDQTADRVQR